MRKLLLYVTLLCLTTACTNDNTPYGNNKALGRYYHIRGMNMYCEVYGKGMPLLMIHGNNGSISTFNRNIGYFAQHYRVIVADSRSQGHSIDPRDSLTFEMMADDYADLLDSLHVASANVLGWSDGGIIALLMATRHPAKVAKLAASGANLWPGTMALNPKEWLEENAEYQELKGIRHVTAEQKKRWKMLALDMQQPHISAGELHTIKCPAFIICGEHDIIRREHTQFIYNNLLYANLWVVPHADHYTISEHVKYFNARVDSFFSQPFHE